LRACLLALLFALSQPAFAGFFNSEKETGWFWKKEPSEEKTEEKKEQKREQRKPPVFSTARSRKELVNKRAELLLKLPESITEEELDKLTPKQVGKLWELYYERALWQPNEKDYENLLKIQNYAIKKSRLHFVAMLDVLRRHPEWNPNVKEPIQTYGRRVNFKAKEREINEYLKKYKDKAGLYFFFERNCKFCMAEAKILKMFQRLTGWSVLPISVDGGCLEDYPECQIDKGLAEKLGIRLYPAIFLVIPNYNGKHFIQPVSYGIMPLDQLRKTIYYILYTLENGHPPEVDKGDWRKLKKTVEKKVPKLPERFKGVASVLNEPEKKADKNFDNLFWGEK